MRKTVKEVVERGSDADVITESLQQFKSVDGLLLDAAKSPVLAHLVPLLRLADGSKDTEEGKEFPQLCLSVTVYFSLSLQIHIC